MRPEWRSWWRGVARSSLRGHAVLQVPNSVCPSHPHTASPSRPSQSRLSPPVSCTSSDRALWIWKTLWPGSCRISRTRRQSPLCSCSITRRVWRVSRMSRRSGPHPRLWRSPLARWLRRSPSLPRTSLPARGGRTTTRATSSPPPSSRLLPACRGTPTWRRPSSRPTALRESPFLMDGGLCPAWFRGTRSVKGATLPAPFLPCSTLPMAPVDWLVMSGPS